MQNGFFVHTYFTKDVITVTSHVTNTKGIFIRFLYNYVFVRNVQQNQQQK